LIIGFTAQTGSDLIYDLGAASSLSDGQTWNLNALLTAGGFDLSSVQWGVIGCQNVAGTRIAWCTKFGSVAPKLPNTSAWNSAVDLNIVSIYNSFPAAGAGQNIQPDSSLANSWNQQTIASANASSFHISYTNPNATGETNLDFYKVIATNSPATLLGHFSLAANGVVTFNTNSVVTPPPTPPVPQIVQVARAGTTSTIYFTTTNSATFTYNLYYTNSAGLTSPISTWAVSPTSVVGNGLTNSIPDTTTDATRFYRVGVH
jgi:hypothetical protein